MEPIRLRRQFKELIGRAIGTMAGTLDTFDAVNNVPSVSGMHSKKSSKKDLKKIISQLVKLSVFDIWPGRKHKSFPKLKAKYIRSLSEKKFKAVYVGPLCNRSVTVTISLFSCL